jgi:hypothetical protein
MTTMNGNYGYNGNPNPLFLNKKLDSLENKEVKDIEYSQLYHKFNKTLYGICLKPFCKFNKNIYKKKLTYNEIKEIKKSYMIYQIPFYLISNDYFRLKNKLVLLNENFLNTINPKEYKLEEYNLCVLFEDIEYLNFIDCIKQFTFSSLFDDLFKKSIFNNHYAIRPNYHVKRKMINDLKEIKGYNFWGKVKNTHLNQTLSFLARKIDFTNIQKLNNKEVKEIIEDIRNRKAEDNNYLNYMHRSYHDLASAIKKKGYDLYKLDQDTLKFTYDLLDTFIDEYIPKEESEFISRILIKLLMNKDLCHLVLKSKYLKYIDFSKEKNEIYFRYAFLTMKLEECCKKSKTRSTDRHMFTLKQANNLPSWTTLPKNVSYNPYFTFLVSKKVMDIENNFLPVDFDGVLVNMQEYKRRFNIFLTGTPNKDPFKDFKLWERFAVTGSINFAIIPRFNGILTRYYFNKNEKDTKYPTKNLREFLDICLKNYYCYSNQYKESDVDIMNNNPTWKGFFEDVLKLKETIDKNLNSISKMKFIKSTCIIINLDFLKHYILKEGEFNTIVDNSVIAEFQSRCNEDIQIKTVIYNYYLKYQILENEKNIKDSIFKNQFYNSFFELVSIEDTFILIKRTDKDWIDYFNSINNKKTPPKYMRNNSKSFKFNKENCLCDISVNIKIKLSNPNLMKPLEIFRIFNSFCGIVNRFHVDGVRSLYRGPIGNNKETVIMHPTAIAACKTGIVQYPKYFAGKRDYIEVANNYHKRGIGIIFNCNEKIHLIDYSFKVDKWRNSYFKNIQGNYISVTEKVKQIVGEPYTKVIFNPFEKSTKPYIVQPFTHKSIPGYEWFVNSVHELFPNKQFTLDPTNNTIIDSEGYLKTMK